MDISNAAERLRRHDETALEAVIKEFTPYVSTIVYNVSKGSMSVPDIEETTADVFLTLWKNCEKISDETLKGYIAAIAKSRAKDKLRRTNAKAAIVDIEDAQLADEYSLPDGLDQKELTRDIESAVNELGEPDREIVIRYYYYYQTAQRISEVTGLNPETVKSRIKRAKPRLRSFLQERGYE